MIAYLILDGHLLWAGLMGIPAGFVDAFDGARRQGQGKTEQVGSVLRLDDRPALGCSLPGPHRMALGVSPDTAEHASETTALLALVALVASFLVSYTKARAESLGFKCDVGIADAPKG